MIKSRVVKRPGYNVNRGSTNPKITVNTVAPQNPKHKDIWLDVSASPAVLMWWDNNAGPAAWTL